MISQESCCYDFQSGSLQLEVHPYGEDSIEIELVNKIYMQQKRQKFKHLILLLFLFGLYYALAKLGTHSGTKVFQRTFIADLGFVFYLFYLTISTFKLVKREKLLFCRNFAMQLETERFFSHNSSFISASNIYDVRINEVIENLDVHYMLIVRTKGEMFIEIPIVPLFNAQKPPINCLELIYKNLNLILCKKKQFWYVC